MKLEIKPTGRGFLRADFKDRYGLNCSIQESAIATERCIWLGADQGTHFKSLTKHNCIDNELQESNINCMALMHLTQEIAGELAKQLAYFARTGKLKDNKTAHKQLKTYICRIYKNVEINNNSYAKWYYVGLYLTKVKIKKYINGQEIANKFPEMNRLINNNDTWFYGDCVISEADFISNKFSKKNIKILQWLSEGQQGFYTPNGLVKELP